MRLSVSDLARLLKKQLRIRGRFRSCFGFDVLLRIRLGAAAACSPARTRFRFYSSLSANL